MTEAALNPRVPARSLASDLCWIAGGVFPLALFSRLVESPTLACPAVSWAAPALIALLATTPHERWGRLIAAAWMALFVALFAGGDDIRTAIERSAAYGLEALTGAWLACRYLIRTAGARTPLVFGGLLGLVALVPPLVGATIASALRLPADLNAGLLEFPTRWLCNYSSESFASLGMFPLALALRRDPLRRLDPRTTAITALLVGIVSIVTVLAVLHMPRPFAFCSLALGSAALVAGPRTRFLLVWTCLASAACTIARIREPEGGLGLAWAELNLFLPAMAIALPIQVLSVSLQRSRQATEVIARSRERFRRLYERAPVMLQSLDEQGRTIEVNAQWLETLGYDSADEVRGAAFDRFLMPAGDASPDPDDPVPKAAPATPWHRQLLSADARKLHIRLRTASGHSIHALASAAFVPDEADATLGVVIAFEDISVEVAMREEIERERDQLAALTSATSDLAVFLDRDLRYRSVNRAFEQDWNIGRDSVIGRHPREVQGQDFFATEIAAPLERALAGEASRFQATIAFPAGPRVMEVALAPAYDARGRKAGVVATLHDVTERVAATRELRQLVEELQHANEGLEQFARIASHDLREPLNTISQFSGLIEEDFGTQLPADARHWFELMGKASVRMKALLDDVLQFARLERTAQVGLETISLDRVFADLRVMLNARLDETHTVLAVAAGLPAVLGQSSLVELLFQNLLTNAMRYTSPGINPCIDVAAERMADLVIVTVSDNGIGIPSRDLERVFAPFHKLHAYRQAEGSGLGLAICRRIATALGGRVWAESENGRGSRLCVALQAAPAIARDAGPERCETARG